MASVDVYRITNKLDDALLEVVITRLEARGKHPSFDKMLQEYLSAMGVDSASKVLDMGCGTGVAARAIARRSGFSGKVTGIDLSHYLAAAATRISNEEGIGNRVEFHAGDTHSLELADGAFDAVVAHTLVSHVDDPSAVIKEAARVVKPGGMVGIFDGDYASMTFSSDDPAKGKAYDEAVIGAIVTNPRVMRQMPQLLRAANLELVSSFPSLIAEIGTADFWVSAIESFARLLPKSGVMDEMEAKSWADSVLRHSAEGVFFGACNYYSFVARKR